MCRPVQISLFTNLCVCKGLLGTGWVITLCFSATFLSNWQMNVIFVNYQWIADQKHVNCVLFRILENIHTSECSFKIIFIHCSVKTKMLMLSENLLRGKQLFVLYYKFKDFSFRFNRLAWGRVWFSIYPRFLFFCCFVGDLNQTSARPDIESCNFWCIPAKS